MPQAPRDSGFGFDGFVVLSVPFTKERTAVAGFYICLLARESFPRLFKEVSLVILKKLSSISGKILILSSFLMTLFIASEVPAQSCNCYDSVSTVRVRRAPVRRVVRRASVRRTYVAARPTYRTTYVPVTREVTYAPRYVEYAGDNDCGEAYVPTSRVYVTEPVYAAAPVRNLYYANGYDSNVYTTYAPATGYVSAYDTTRIANGWGRRDGFKDGWKAALKYREYNPENNGDYRDANNGYKGRFGDKYVYKSAYRDGYVNGYDEGFRSINQNRVINY